MCAVEVFGGRRHNHVSGRMDNDLWRRILESHFVCFHFNMMAHKLHIGVDIFVHNLKYHGDFDRHSGSCVAELLVMYLLQNLSPNKSATNGI